MKYAGKAGETAGKKVALLRGGAWIEMLLTTPFMAESIVALLRGGAWIEIYVRV